jgi:hypothetical protein
VAIWYILWIGIWYVFPVLVCCAKQYLATLCNSRLCDQIGRTSSIRTKLQSPSILFFITFRVLAAKRYFKTVASWPRRLEIGVVKRKFGGFSPVLPLVVLAIIFQTNLDN